MSVDVPENRRAEFVQVLKDYIVDFEKLLESFNEVVENTSSVLAESRDGTEGDEVVMERFRQLKLFRAFLDEVGSVLGQSEIVTMGYNDVLSCTPWIDTAHFSHNLGHNAWQGVWGEFSYAVRLGSGDGRFQFMLQNLPHLITQTIAHLQSMIFFVDPSEYEEAEKGCAVIDAIQTTVRSRIYFTRGVNLVGLDGKA